MMKTESDRAHFLFVRVSCRVSVARKGKRPGSETAGGQAYL